MQTESYLPHLHQPATCPYTAPDGSSRCQHSTSPKSILILSSHLPLSLPMIFFPLVSPPKFCMHLSSPPYMLRALPISVFFIWSSRVKISKSLATVSLQRQKYRTGCRECPPYLSLDTTSVCIMYEKSIIGVVTPFYLSTDKLAICYSITHKRVQVFHFI